LSKSSIIDLGEPILNAQKAVSTGAKGLKLMSVIAETASYVSEFSCRDMYSVNALEKVAKSLPYVKSDVSFYTKVALMDGAVDFKSNALDYSVERFLRENVADIAFDIANVISTKANLILLAWNIASNFIPFLSEGFAAAEKYELSIYAMALQNETYKLYYQKLSEYTSAGQYLTPERVQELSQYAYVYLKTCLIARDAAIGGIHVSKKYKSIAEEVKKDLKGKNDAITPLLSLAKDTANENKKLSTGFLKSHSDSFDELFNDKYIVDIMKDTQTSVPDDSYDEQVNFEYDISLYNYYVELERIEDVSSAYNDGSAFLYDMDRDGAQELVTLTLYHSPEGENMEEFCYSVYDITQDRVVRIDREFLGYNVAGPGGRVGVGTTDDNKMVFYTVYDNGETSSEDGKPKRETEYKIYYIGSDTTNMDFVTTINRKYKGEDTLEILVNGKTGTEDDYRLFTEITPIIEAEIYKNDPSDGSLRLYDMSEYLLNN